MLLDDAHMFLKPSRAQWKHFSRSGTSAGRLTNSIVNLGSYLSDLHSCHSLRDHSRVIDNTGDAKTAEIHCAWRFCGWRFLTIHS